jgi:hypothetical protein
MNPVADRFLQQIFNGIHAVWMGCIYDSVMDIKFLAEPPSQRDILLSEGYPFCVVLLTHVFAKSSIPQLEHQIYSCLHKSMNLPYLLVSV